MGVYECQASSLLPKMGTKIEPYTGMYPGGQQQQHHRMSEEDQESVDSFDLDYLAREESPTSIVEDQQALSFENTIKNSVLFPEEVNPDASVERKHGCQICAKRFRTKWHLTEHMIVHTGIYPFQCECCKKGFKRRKALETHPCIYDRWGDEEKEEKPVSTPSTTITYTCPHCLVEFTTRTNYLRHTCSLEDSYIFKQKKEDDEGEDRVIVFQEPHGEAVEVEKDVKSKQKEPTDFYRDTLRIEDGIDAIADLTGLSIQEVNDTLEYFCKKFDAAEEHHKKAVQTLKVGEVPIRHSSQDESEHAIEMF